MLCSETVMTAYLLYEHLQVLQLHVHCMVHVVMKILKYFKCIQLWIYIIVVINNDCVMLPALPCVAILCNLKMIT